MLRRQMVIWGAAFLCVLACNACVPQANNLAPRYVNGGQGAFFGHIEVVNDRNQDITGSCYILWTDGRVYTGAMSMDKTGWVFSTVSIGPTFLWEASCAQGTFSYTARDVAFQVPGNGTIVYFGHVRIQSLASTVQNRFSEALFEYNKRYGEDAWALRAEPAILDNSRDAVGVFASASPPTLAAGFALGGDLASAQTLCTGAGLTWQKIGDGAASCSGAAVDIGMPLTVKLTACAEEAICEVVLDASGDGAAWSTLTQRFKKLTTLLEKEHGNQHQRVTRALEGCAPGTTDCAASGRALKSETWRWPDKRRVSLILDGGPLGGAPSLRVIYHTGAFAERKP